MNLRSHVRAANCGRPRFLASAVAILTGALVIAGCEGQSTQRPRRQMASSSAASAEQDHLAQAMEVLQRFHEIEPSEAQRQVLYHLNRWGETQPADATWRVDPLVDRLPRRFRELPEFAALNDRVFRPDDTRYLTEAVLLRSIAQWVSDDVAQRWMAAKQAAAGDALVVDAALDSPEYRLEVAKSLFDWTVRHVQLEKMLPYPQSAPAGNSSAAERLTPPEQAIPGPGYRFYPGQTVFFGTGDAWQRTRVFILLARQRGLDAVMLAVDDRGEGSRARLWCPAVLIDDQAYLFDSALGLPLPGPEAGSVATLAQVLNEPELLRRLDVEDDDQTLRYPVSAPELRSVAALVDADPEALARRMKMLEDRLTGDKLLALAVSPTALAERLRACPGLSGVSVRLWTLPYETRIYRQSLERLARRDPEAQRRLLQEEGSFVPSIRHARQLHFLGQIQGDQEDPGAIAYYMESRKADQWIEAVQTSEEARLRIGLAPLPPELTPQQREMALAIQTAQLRLNKQHASYWLGLAQYDLGQYETAIDWLRDRTLEAYPEGVWTAGARYNLGRTYEALGRIDDARRLYFQSESPQRHGDLLRAKLLREAS